MHELFDSDPQSELGARFLYYIKVSFVAETIVHPAISAQTATFADKKDRNKAKLHANDSSLEPFGKNI